MKKLMLAFAAVAAMGAFADAYVYVDAARGNDEDCDGSWEKPAKSIRKGFKLAGAVPSSQKKVIISVQPGTYAGGVIFSGTGASFYDYEDGKGNADRSGGHVISIRGQTGDVDNADPTLVIIDAQHKTNCVSMAGGNASLCNVTCQNGVWGHHQDNSPQWEHTAGGIAIYNGAMASNCIVRWCENRDTSGKWHRGGGVMLRGKDSRIIDSQILSCTNVIATGTAARADGGGLCVMDGASYASGLLVSNCCCVSELSGKNEMNGGGVWLAERAGTLVDSHVVDCYITNLTSKTHVGTGGGVAAHHWPSCVTNCLIERCWAANGGGLSCNYGGRAYYTTVTNCWGSYAVYSGSADDPSDEQMAQLVGVRVVGCKNVSVPLRFYFSHIYDCLVENNSSSSHTVEIGALIDQRFTNTVQRTVIRNNVSTGGHTLYLGEDYIEKVCGCWIVGNTASATKYTVCDGWSGWRGKSFMQECVISGNTAGGAISTGSKGPNAFPEKYSGTLVNEAGFVGLTIADNSYSDSTIAVYDNAFVDYVTFTNCYVTANGTCKTFSASCKKMTAGTISHCFVTEGANLPDDSEGVAKNVVGKSAFYEDTFVPRASTHTHNAGVPLAYMTASDYRSMGDGMYSVEQVGKYGVHIVPNDTKRRARISGGAPDIGACESRQPGLMLMVK